MEAKNVTSPSESKSGQEATQGDPLWVRIVKRQIREKRAQEMAENLTAAMGGDDAPLPAPAKASPTL